MLAHHGKHVVNVTCLLYKSQMRHAYYIFFCFLFHPERRDRATDKSRHDHKDVRSMLLVLTPLYRVEVDTLLDELPQRRQLT